MTEATRVSAEQMAGTAQKFDDGSQELASMLRNLMGQLSATQATWAGEGARAFEQTRAQYESDVQALQKALALTADHIKVSGTSYQSSDSAAASAITKSGGGGISLPLEN
ncbi:WXG100 family type VII secretion target [Actinoplanes sp. NPDC051859]|uniref:WXG100 family type VII secretion target n=1 Tax=Actinoplanes sp. NPDC051859 TaxID=3363909 RepID=UPI0037940AEA